MTWRLAGDKGCVWQATAARQSERGALDDERSITLDQISRRAAELGLAVRGAFRPETADAVPALPDGAAPGTFVLLGWTGAEQWPAFAGSAEALDGRPHPLDRWSRRVICALAREHHAVALFPFDGPPWLPFQLWAKRAEPVFVSPLRLLIHPRWGLWHSYRGALALPGRLDLPDDAAQASPCDTCADRPCLSACPVEAFAPGAYDVAACTGHVASDAGRDCRLAGCLSRRACPVGREHAYGLEEGTFFMRAFLGARVGTWTR